MYIAAWSLYVYYLDILAMTEDDCLHVQVKAVPDQTYIKILFLLHGFVELLVSIVAVPDSLGWVHIVMI